MNQNTANGKTEVVEIKIFIEINKHQHKSLNETKRKQSFPPSMTALCFQKNIDFKNFSFIIC